MPTCTLEQAVDHVLARIDGPIRLGLPLGLGKPCAFVNALYQRIKAQPQRSLTLYTALSLSRPEADSELEQRFSGPFLRRVFADSPELDYLADLRCGDLPPNVRLEEFYLQPGSQLGNPLAQQHYISQNYSQVAHDLDRKGLNVIAQLVARRDASPGRLSLSCNPDITVDLLPRLEARRAAGESVLCIAQVHEALPYMLGEAEVAEERFDLLIEPAERRRLFSMPNLPVSAQDHAIGLYASALVRDGGTLQIGIGAMGDALAAALLARHTEPADYRALLDELEIDRHGAGLVAREGGLAPFEQGVYGCSEMFVLGLLELMEAGVVRRPVYPDERLQRLADAGGLTAEGRLGDIAAWERAGLATRLDAEALAWLRRVGLLAADVAWTPEGLVLPDGQRRVADLADPQTAAALRALGGAAAGVWVHGGFFLGPQAFYRRLAELDETSRARIGMTGIRFINRLYGDEALKRAQRRHARFVNSCFKVTLLGASAADQLEDGRVISGVGGQYDFVAQAHELEDARSILMLRSWRESAGEVSSNIVWEYAHTTIPRHLRDIVVTEYGIADLRGKNDAEVIAALLSIADARFQDDLIAQAQQAGKLPRDFRLDEACRRNTPERLRALRDKHPRLFAEYPLGCDFTPVEQDLLRALGWLKGKLRLSEIVELGVSALVEAPDPAPYGEHLRRLGLDDATGLREQLYRKGVLAGLAATAPGTGDAGPA